MQEIHSSFRRLEEKLILGSGQHLEDGTIVNPTSDSPYVLNAADSDTFQVVITDMAGCTDSCTVVATVRALPTCTA